MNEILVVLRWDRHCRHFAAREDRCIRTADEIHTRSIQLRGKRRERVRRRRLLNQHNVRLNPANVAHHGRVARAIERDNAHRSAAPRRPPAGTRKAQRCVGRRDKKRQPEHNQQHAEPPAPTRISKPSQPQSARRPAPRRKQRHEGAGVKASPIAGCHERQQRSGSEPAAARAMRRQALNFARWSQRVFPLARPPGDLRNRHQSP